jgi:hypothetical protein
MTTEPPKKVTAYHIQRTLFFKLVSTSKVVMPNFTPIGWFECDFFRVTQAGFFYEYEIKLSVSDFKADRRKNLTIKEGSEYNNYSKAELIESAKPRAPHRFFYVIPNYLYDEIYPILPTWAGLICVTPVYYNMSTVKQAPKIHDKKVSKIIIDDACRSSVYRYWNLLLTKEII